MRKTDDITSLAKKARLLAKTRKKKFRMMQHKRVDHEDSEASEDEVFLPYVFGTYPKAERV